MHFNPVHQLEVASHLLRLKYELATDEGGGAGRVGRNNVSTRRVLQGWVFRFITERQTHKVHFFLTVPSPMGCVIKIRSDHFAQFSLRSRKKKEE
jgi:hypothetical protein